MNDNDEVRPDIPGEAAPGSSAAEIPGSPDTGTPAAVSTAEGTETPQIQTEAAAVPKNEPILLPEQMPVSKEDTWDGPEAGRHEAQFVEEAYDIPAPELGIPGEEIPESVPPQATAPQTPVEPVNPPPPSPVGNPQMPQAPQNPGYPQAGYSPYGQQPTSVPPNPAAPQYPQYPQQPPYSQQPYGYPQGQAGYPPYGQPPPNPVPPYPQQGGGYQPPYPPVQGSYPQNQPPNPQNPYPQNPNGAGQYPPYPYPQNGQRNPYPQGSYPPQGQYQPPYQGSPYAQQGRPQNGSRHYQGNPYPQQYQYPPQGQNFPQGQYLPQSQNLPQGQYPIYGRPREKMNLGLKVFLWILGTFCVLSLGMLIGKGISELLNGGTEVPYRYEESVNPGKSPETSPAQPNPGKTDPGNSGILLEPQPKGSKMEAGDIYSNIVRSVVGIETTVGEGVETQGSGIISTADGYIITNAHVVGNTNTSKVRVLFYDDDKEYDAAVVGFDNTTDLAILKVDRTGLTPAVFGNSDELQVGDWVLAVGSPGGVSFSNTLTGGYVSALDRKLKTRTSNELPFIQTDAAINPGNSGGPLVNMYGQVVGINSNKVMATGYEGMGFAIPAARAKSVLDDLTMFGYVKGRAKLGITVQDTYGQDNRPQGVAIVSIGSESSLNGTGIEENDIITGLDGKEVTEKSQLYDILLARNPGDQITIQYYSISEGKDKEAVITLLEASGE